MPFWALSSTELAISTKGHNIRTSKDLGTAQSGRRTWWTWQLPQRQIVTDRTKEPGFQVMTNSPRLDDLRRLIQRDPASIAFAQLAEELRRSGALQEAVDTCRAGLRIHPSYLSARVTLGRALLELNQLDEAEVELGRVLTNAGDNLAALRGLGEICSRRGASGEALKYYQTALVLAPNDPDLEAVVANLAGAPEPEPATTEGATVPPTSVVQVPALVAEAPVDAVSCVPPTPGSLDPSRDRATRLVAALQTWLDAIDVSRTDRRA